MKNEMKVTQSNNFHKSLIKGQGGFLAVDFLFSMIIAALVSMMLFAMASTYTVIEIAQYIAFSSARAHASAHINYQEQQKLARAQFAKLTADPVLGPLFRNGWFELTLEDVRSGKSADQNDFEADYPKSTGAPIPQVGVRLQLNAKLLKMRLGPLGSSDDGNGNGFTTKITGFLIREPTWEECWDQMKLDPRYESILRLDSRYGGIAGPGKARGYLAMEDNGC
ncbi:MAG: hypothetical protein V4736_06625 [Bdellovibrionota bacterium]